MSETQASANDAFAKLVMTFHKNAVNKLKTRNAIPIEKKEEREAIFEEYREIALDEIIASS